MILSDVKKFTIPSVSPKKPIALEVIQAARVRIVFAMSFGFGVVLRHRWIVVVEHNIYWYTFFVLQVRRSGFVFFLQQQTSFKNALLTIGYRSPNKSSVASPCGGVIGGPENVTNTILVALSAMTEKRVRSTLPKFVHNEISKHHEIPISQWQSKC